jgi:steroid delta-isomerase-like uncharacterized protein
MRTAGRPGVPSIARWREQDVNENENETVIRAMLELANRHDGTAIHAYLAEAMRVSHPGTGISPASRQHAIQSALLEGFPDLQYRMERMLASGNTVVIECTLIGTHKGAFAGVPPTNKTIELPTVFWVEITDGKLTDCRSYLDTLTLMEQIGARPAQVGGAGRATT